MLLMESKGPSNFFDCRYKWLQRFRSPSHRPAPRRNRKVSDKISISDHSEQRRNGWSLWRHSYLPFIEGIKHQIEAKMEDQKDSLDRNEILFHRSPFSCPHERAWQGSEQPDGEPFPSFVLLEVLFIAVPSNDPVSTDHPCHEETPTQTRIKTDCTWATVFMDRKTTWRKVSTIGLKS